MSSQYYNTHQSYPQPPVQNGYLQRPSSSASQLQPQAFPHQNFQPQGGGFEFGPQYAFHQSNDWAHSQVESASFPTSGASQLDVTEINEYTSSAREPSWDPVGRTQARNVDSSLQLCSPASPSYIARAHTVAGATNPSPVFKRPFPRPRPSYVSIPDSGYGSQSTVVESIPGVSQAEVKDVVFLPADPSQSVTQAPTRALSVKTDPNPIAKRRRSKSFLENCRECGKELKNKSESV